MLQWLYHPCRPPNHTASPLHATSSTLGIYKQTCQSLPLVTPSISPSLRACISLSILPASQHQPAQLHFQAHQPSFDTAAPKRGVSTTMRKIFNQCIHSPSDATLATCRLRRFIRAFGMVLGIAKSSFRLHKCVHNKCNVAVT
jgi:hypothetical protein